MSIQIIVKAKTAREIEAALGSIASECEIFPFDTADWGVSIPSKIIDKFGNKNIDAALDKLEHFDLWAGAWRSAKRR